MLKPCREQMQVQVRNANISPWPTVYREAGAHRWAGMIVQHCEARCCSAARQVRPLAVVLMVALGVVGLHCTSTGHDQGNTRMLHICCLFQTADVQCEQLTGGGTDRC